MSEHTVHTNGSPVNVRRLVADYGQIAALVAGLVWVGVELRSLRDMATQNQNAVAGKPSVVEMENTLLKSIRPLDISVAELKAEVTTQIRALTERVRRLEDTKQ